MGWQTCYTKTIGQMHYINEWIEGHPSDYPYGLWVDASSLAARMTAMWGSTYPPFDVYRIYASGYHDYQVAFRSHDADSPVWVYCDDPDDTPNWGGAIQSSTTDSCGNYEIYLLGSPETTRSQTSRLITYISNWRELAPQICAYICNPHDLNDGITASIQAEQELPITVQAAILGNADKAVGIRAAIRDQPELAPGITAAAAKTDELADGLTATVQSDVQLNPWIRTAILGETQLEVSIATFIVVSRKDTIRLEMENLGPQEFAHRTVPNWASRVKDYRTDSLGS